MAPPNSAERRAMTVMDNQRVRVDSQGWRPRNVVWELTLGCNLRCKHCGSGAGQPRPHELDTAECLSLVDQLVELGCELVTLSGGEPTLREDWCQIAQALAGRGVKVNMVTNGVFASDARRNMVVQQVQRAGLCNVGLSVDGPAMVHDEIRGPDTFEATAESIRCLVRAGVDVAVLTTVSQVNLHHLEDVRRLVEGWGVKTWRLQLAKPMGNLDSHRDWMLQPAQLLHLVPWLASIQASGSLRVTVGDSLGYHGPHDQVLRGWGWRGRRECWQGCQAGMQALGIESDGGIKGCLSLQAHPGGADVFREGCVRDQTLQEIWYRPDAFAYNRSFDPGALTGFCRTCGHAQTCRGGARCVAAAVTGGITEDPFCFHRVDELQRMRSTRSARSSAAAAAAALALGLGTPSCKPSTGSDDPAVVVKDASVIPRDAGHEDAASPALDASRPDAALPDDAGRVDANTVAGDAAQPPKPDAAVPDASICEAVCCSCEYGVIPPDLYEQCCTPVDAGTHYVPDANTPPTDAGEDCTNVCCDCDYGVPPPPHCCP